MLSEAKRGLYQSIAQFLQDELSIRDYSGDTIESLEVAKQCLDSAFNLSENVTSKPVDLLDIYELSTKAADSKVGISVEPPKPSPEYLALAENLKTQGNHCMSEEKFAEAVACYSKAIELDSASAVYFCNRAAAYERLKKHDESIKDCENALEIDPTYSKAYGRMGLAYSSKGNLTKAIECYKKAISLDPTNTNFQQNLSIAEARLQDSNTSAQTIPGGLDLGALFSSPAIQNLTQRFMTDPQLQNTMSTMMQTILGGSANVSATGETNTATATSDDSATPNINLSEAPMDNLLRIGQQFAEQMQQTNPDLVSSLRQRMQAAQADPRSPNSGESNPNVPNSG